MKKYSSWIIGIFLLIANFNVFAQISDPVKWSISSNEIDETTYEIVFKAEIEKGWHVYSQFIEGEEGPIPTELSVKAKGLTKVGKTQEPKGITAFDKTFDMTIKYFEDEAVFRQKVKIDDSFKGTVDASAFFMVCNDERCLPPDEVLLKVNLGTTSTNKKRDVVFESHKEDEINWSVYSNKIDETTFEVVFKAALKKGWHVYSQFIEGEEGPIPTEFSVKAEGLTKIGDTQEPKGITAFDKTFDMTIKYFEDEAIFTQKVKIKDSFKDPIEASVFFMVCNDERCLPPDEVIMKAFLKDSSITAVTVQDTATETDNLKSNELKIPLQIKNFVLSSTKEETLWKLFFLGFLGGFIALLTPCVFPMIPLTVSFFSHSSSGLNETKSNQGIVKAVLYGFFIFLVYVLVSLPFHILDSANPDMLNNVSTNTWLNVLFFVVFVVFAISFFGYFEITLPSKWSNAMDSKANKVGGYLGVFFMALTLVLVSFSCTGPILGSLLGGSLSNDGGAIQLTYGLAGFGLALALPFAFFALFPNLLKKLPKSGGWMTTVKVVLGFIELAFALKFLSNADLVEHWGLLKREIFVGIWILVFLGLAAYLFGLYKFPHDAPNQKISIGRKVIGFLALAFSIYLVPGILPSEEPNLKLLSGFPPPTFYSIYNDEDASSDHFGENVFTDFEEGVNRAKALNKPILIDFTGWACVNCRKMEEQVWVTPGVKQIIEHEVVLISLYVDDRKELPIEEQFVYTYPNSTKTKNIKTIGNKWAAFQTINFKNNSQPYYVLMDANYNLLEEPIGYTPDAKAYENWLKTGLVNFSKN